MKKSLGTGVMITLGVAALLVALGASFLLEKYILWIVVMPVRSLCAMIARCDQRLVWYSIAVICCAVAVKAVIDLLGTSTSPDDVSGSDVRLGPVEELYRLIEKSAVSDKDRIELLIRMRTYALSGLDYRNRTIEEAFAGLPVMYRGTLSEAVKKFLIAQPRRERKQYFFSVHKRDREAQSLWMQLCAAQLQEILRILEKLVE